MDPPHLQRQPHLARSCSVNCGAHLSASSDPVIACPRGPRARRGSRPCCPWQPVRARTFEPRHTFNLPQHLHPPRHRPHNRCSTSTPPLPSTPHWTHVRAPESPPASAHCASPPNRSAAPLSPSREPDVAASEVASSSWPNHMTVVGEATHVCPHGHAPAWDHPQATGHSRSHGIPCAPLPVAVVWPALANGRPPRAPSPSVPLQFFPEAPGFYQLSACALSLGKLVY